MAEFPNYEQMAKEIAEIALDKFLYDGKSIREWTKIIIEQEPCEDCISRAELEKCFTVDMTDISIADCLALIIKRVKALPSIQPKPKTDVLDKIRAEIAELELGISRYHHYRPWIFRDEVLEIIDKYKAESEDKG